MVQCEIYHVGATLAVARDVPTIEHYPSTRESKDLRTDSR